MNLQLIIFLLLVASLEENGAEFKMPTKRGWKQLAGCCTLKWWHHPFSMPRNMKFLANEQYHIYNRGNNKQQIFFRPDHYRYFLRKLKWLILPVCDLLAYCLMPNHFHFQIHADERTVKTKVVGGVEMNVLSRAIKILLSSYTRAINDEFRRTGSLFQQNTKAKLLTVEEFYPNDCFDYIHRNPMKANLVKRMEDWPYSSFGDYCNPRRNSMCNRELSICLLRLDMSNFYENSYSQLSSNSILES